MVAPTLTLTFDQPDAGLPAGQTDRARTDIQSTGPSDSARAYAVLIAVGGVPDGASADVALLDEPPGANPLLTQLSPSSWQLEFDKGCWGPFRVRARALLSDTVLASVVRRISIRSPQLGFQYPANAERTDPAATSVATAPSVALTEMNERGFLTVGLDSAGDQNLAAVELRQPLALVLGAEGKGLRQLTRETCSVVARLDMPGEIKSLNVSNAAVLALYVGASRLGLMS